MAAWARHAPAAGSTAGSAADPPWPGWSFAVLLRRIAAAAVEAHEPLITALG
jgi:hypothetical protein